jgi:hypothetical protein
MIEIVLDVPIQLPTGNDLSGRHWSARWRMREEWRHAVWALALEQGIREPRYARVEVLVERHAWRPIRDYDNLYAGFKAAGDSLVAAGLLLDDSTNVITSLKIVQVKAPKGTRRTVLRLRRVGSNFPTSAPAPPVQSPA